MVATTIQQKLDYLISQKVATLNENVKWGSGLRNVVVIEGKKYQYKGSDDINITLQNKITSLYIDMPKSSKEKTKNYDDEAQKKVRTIQRTLRNQITFKVDKVDEAFNDKVKSITIVPKYVGRDFDDLDHAVYKAFMLAEKQVDNNKRYKFFTLFENNGGDKPFHVRTATYGDGSSAKNIKMVRQKCYRN